jgi:hypothetical protein
MFCLAILGMFILDDIVGNDEDDLFGDLSFRLGVVWIYAMFLESERRIFGFVRRTESALLLAKSINLTAIP